MVYRIGHWLRSCGPGGAVIVTTLMIVSLKAAGDGRAAERFAHARGKARCVRPVTLPGLNVPSRARVSHAEQRPAVKLKNPLDERRRALQPHSWPACGVRRPPGEWPDRDMIVCPA